MAFSFVKTKSNTNLPHQTSTITGTNLTHDNNNLTLSPTNKLPFASKTAIKQQYPAWLRDSASCLKQLPGIYHGVLGQVQLQPTLIMSDSNKFTNGLEKLVKEHQKTDYLNRFTDTERVHQLLSTSRLSNEHLATIWAHVNKTFPGQLTNREVCLALALIAIFQRLDSEGRNLDESQNDPFQLVKLEKKAPLPTLFPSDHKSSSSQAGQSSKLAASSSVPNDLSTGGLLIDITSDADNGGSPVGIQGESTRFSQSSIGNGISLIDMDTDIDGTFQRLAQVWAQVMFAMKALFKRSFDILNVENSRNCALEALRSPRGIEFCKNLGLCYPIAHNIKYKIDELIEFQRAKINENMLSATTTTTTTTTTEQQQYAKLFDKNYPVQINDLMISINEYWAVLINLFHESGQTNFIELIMDGLNRNIKTLESETLAELSQEMQTGYKPDTCALCLTKFYLVNIGDALDMRDVSSEDLELVLSNELLSDDDCHYYHAKCANFWLNNVQQPGGSQQLPFSLKNNNFNFNGNSTQQILKPTSI